MFPLKIHIVKNHKTPDVLIIGAGASGLMCAIHAARKGLKVLILEKNQKAGMKILVSGGGRCNFTNLWADPEENYLSENPHFCISAMRRYSPYDFIEMVEQHGIGYHEKTLGQQFCNNSAKQIQKMLLDECGQQGVEIKLNSQVNSIEKESDAPFGSIQFRVQTEQNSFTAKKVVIASGGLSIPKIASDLAYRAAENFDLSIVPPRAGLVPLTWNSKDKNLFESLSGISLPAKVQCNNISFREALLFTHRGLSGPSILQISTYWREGDSLSINLLPDMDCSEWLLESRQNSPQQKLANILKAKLPNRLVDLVAGRWFEDRKIGSLSPTELKTVAESLTNWQFKPGGSEGYRTAEVTLGGIHTDELSSKTFETKKVPNLYAIGEAIDVTGWLGGYNFQWAWASAYSCALHL